MTIDEAIAILTKWEEPKSVDEAEKLAKAVALGAEALKWKKRWSACFKPKNYKPLPGETKEGG